MKVTQLAPLCACLIWPVDAAVSVPKQVGPPAGQPYRTKHFQLTHPAPTANLVTTSDHGGAFSGSSRRAESLEFSVGGVAQSVEQRTFNPTDIPPDAQD